MTPSNIFVILSLRNGHVNEFCNFLHVKFQFKPYSSIIVTFFAHKTTFHLHRNPNPKGGGGGNERFPGFCSTQDRIKVRCDPGTVVSLRDNTWHVDDQSIQDHQQENPHGCKQCKNAYRHHCQPVRQFPPTGLDQEPFQFFRVATIQMTFPDAFPEKRPAIRQKLFPSLHFQISSVDPPSTLPAERMIGKSRRTEQAVRHCKANRHRHQLKHRP
jgi:hypothetical protein